MGQWYTLARCQNALAWSLGGSLVVRADLRGQIRRPWARQTFGSSSS